MKPSFFKNELLATSDPLYSLIFEGLWCLADREGRLEDRPRRIHFEINAGRAYELTEKSLDWLAENGFIQRYEHGGARYIQVVNFKKHQNPHVREPASTIPAPDEHSASTGPARLIPSSLIPDSPSLIPDSESGAATPRRAPVGEPSEFIEIRKAYPKRSGGQRWGDALKFFRRRLTEGDDPKAILAGVARYAAFCRATGIERTEKVQQAATFLGDNRGYLESWALPTRQMSAVEKAREKLRGETHESDGSDDAAVGQVSRLFRRLPAP